MGEKKGYVKLWLSYETYFGAYTPEQVGNLTLAMLAYKNDGTEPEFYGPERFIWPAIRRDIDESRAAQEAAARAAQRISGTGDHGITQLFGDRHAFVHRISDIGRNDRLVYLFHRRFEKLAVFRAVDRAQRRADEPHAPLFQKARLRKLIAHGQPRLSA